MEIRRKWELRRVASLAFGGLLWLQLATEPLSRELAFARPDPRRIVVYVLPIVLLVVTALRRNKILALFLFPSSFGGVVILTPPSAMGAGAGSMATVLAALTLVAYVASASAWLQLPEHQHVLEATREPLRHDLDRWRPYRGTFLPRAALLVAAFAVTAAAVCLVPDLIERAQHAFGDATDPRSTEKGLILTNLILFFAWCVMAFLLFVAPALEMESRTRHLETQVQAIVSRADTAGRKVSFFVLVAVGLVLMGALVALRML